MATLLYIEDEEDYQLLVKRIVGKAGFDLHVAASRLEGLELLERCRPDLLILDVNLPDGDGYAICRELRQREDTHDLPILLLTVKRRPEEWLEGFSAGANDYVPKPLNPVELVERVRRCLEPVNHDENHTPEYLLIQAAVRGNRTAFEVLIRKYRERLLGALRAAGNNHVTAEELAADAFAIAYERLRQFKGQASFYTWLYRIALNQSFRPRYRPTGSSLESAPEPEGDQVSTHLGPEVHLQLREAVAGLPRPYQQVLKGYFIKGWSCDRLSRKLRIPPGTVMSRLFKAKALFRQSFRRTELLKG